MGFSEVIKDGQYECVAQLKGGLKKCFDNGGTVLIPAFSLGRTQELLYELESVLPLGNSRVLKLCGW
jgi:Cft2 family RNA processing exonuclease